jgi:hypothetical protein
MTEEKSVGLSSEFSSFVDRAEALLLTGDLDGARAVYVSGREAARKLRDTASEASFLRQTTRIDRLLSPKP